MLFDVYLLKNILTAYKVMKSRLHCVVTTEHYISLQLNELLQYRRLLFIELTAVISRLHTEPTHWLTCGHDNAGDRSQFLGCPQSGGNMIPRSRQKVDQLDRCPRPWNVQRFFSGNNWAAFGR